MNRQRCFRSLATALLVATAVTAPLAATAGMLDRWFKKGGGEPPETARYDLEPTQVFDGGTLGTDLSGRWRLGGSVLVFEEGSRIVAGGQELEPRSLRMGQEARLTGHRLADGRVAVHRLRLLTTRQPSTGLGSLGGLEPRVGVAPRGGPR